MPESLEPAPAAIGDAGVVGVRTVPRVGVDLADPAEVAASIAHFGDRYLDRVYTAAERVHTGDAPERLAARFAAKEAVIKLLRPSADVPIAYRDVEVLSDDSGAPRVGLAPRAAELARRGGLGTIAVSLSHERGLAAAAAVALAREAAREVVT